MQIPRGARIHLHHARVWVRTPRKCHVERPRQVDVINKPPPTSQQRRVLAAPYRSSNEASHVQSRVANQAAPAARIPLNPSLTTHDNAQQRSRTCPGLGLTLQIGLYTV